MTTSRVLSLGVVADSDMRPKPRVILPPGEQVRGRYRWRNVDQIIRWLDRLDSEIDSRRSLMVDIETDGKDRWRCKLRCIGIGYWRRDGSRSVVSIPWRRWNGAFYWSLEDRQRLRLAIRKRIIRYRVAGQFIIFDRTVLQRLGFWPEPCEREFIDLPVLHHNTLECDAPHDLAFISSRLDPPPILWKGDVDHEARAASAVKGADVKLRRYNVRDVWYQMSIESMLWRWIRRDKTAKQNRIDTKKSVIAANMHQLGFVIHLPTREEFHEKLLDIAREQAKILKELVGKDFNPRSGPQIAEHLYEKKGYYPVVDKRGRELDEGKRGEDRLTSQPALIGLIRHGVDKETEKVIKHVLLYKAARACDSTFVKGLPVKRHPLLDPKIFGIVRSTFNVHRVASGRLASTSPNLMNWPKRGLLNLRKMIWAAPGHKLVSADFDAGELRLWGCAIGDRMMLEAFTQNKKPHLLNAAAIFAELKSQDLAGKPSEIYEKLTAWSKAPEGSPERRIADKAKDLAKTVHFSMQYGATFPRVRTTIRFARDKLLNTLFFPEANDELCRAAYDAWYAAHDRVDEWIESIVAFVEEHEYVIAPGHDRKRCFPGGPNKPGAPVNHMIQSRLAYRSDNALIFLANQIGHRRRSYWSGLQNQVHDEIVAQVLDEDVEETCELFAEAFESTEQSELGLVRMFGEAKAQEYWTGPEIRSGR